jgi:SAM-dependent MidA family methyltransferase
MVSNHRKHNPDSPFHIYELGAGNGSFMLDCLDHIRNTAPDVFETMRYTIIEISQALADGQRKRAKEKGLDEHVEIVREDFFNWKGGETGPCYVVALEVLVSRSATDEA